MQRHRYAVLSDGFLQEHSNSDIFNPKIHIFFLFISKLRGKVFERTSVGENLRRTSVGRNFKSMPARKKNCLSQLKISEMVKFEK